MGPELLIWRELDVVAKIVNFDALDKDLLRKELRSFDMSSLLEAYRYYTGFGVSSFPVRDVSKFYERYGESIGNRLMSFIYLLHYDYYSFDGDETLSRECLGRLASADFRERYHEVP